MSKSIKLLLLFLLHIFIASVLFAAVAGIAYALWLGTEWLKSKGIPDEFYRGIWGVAELLFWVDVLCFVIFLITEVWKLLREITEDWKLLRKITAWWNKKGGSS